MKLEHLTSYGILPPFIERWRQTMGEELLDWQADAIVHYGLLGHPSTAAGADPPHNLLVVAPTSSGKTFIGELAAAAALSHRAKVIFIVPLKALAAEKYRHFREVFGPLGFTTHISTRDHRNNDSALISGDFDIAVVVAEKFRHLLIRNFDLLQRVNLVVGDELHLLADPDRGPALLSVIEKLAHAEFTCRFIGLSAQLPDSDTVAKLLNARIMRVCRRPVELRRGVLCDGAFRYREDNSGETGTEHLLEITNRNDATLEIIKQQLLDDERILVFSKTKYDCHCRAAALTEVYSVNNELTDADRWILSADGFITDDLTTWYSRGIGVHHADMSLAQRALTERMFRDGALRIVFCTGTLAMGVNLPATTVYVEAERFCGGRYGTAPVLTPLEPHEFNNAAGRAGRLGLMTSYGRAILCAQTPIEADILWDTYINPAPAREDFGILQWPETRRRILEAVACGLVDHRDACAAYLHQDAGPYIDQLAKDDLLAADTDGRLRATPTGLIVATTGVSPESIAHLRTLVAHASTTDPVIWTAAILALPDSADIRWPYRHRGAFDPLAAAWREQFGDDFESTLSRTFSEAFRPEVWYPRPQLRRRAIAAALALGDWAKGEPGERLLVAHQAPPGRFEQTAETVSWLTDTATALAEADPRYRMNAPALARMAFEMRFGLPWSLHELATAVSGEIPREGILRLAQLGWRHPRSLAQAKPGDFGEILPLPIAERAIERGRQWLREEKRRTPAEPQPSTASTDKNSSVDKTISNKEATMPQALTLDGRQVHTRFAVALGDNLCTLRAKSFKYLFALAAARHLRKDGWIDKRDIEAGENQIKYFYQLRQELKAAQDGAHQLIENDGSGRYRLALPRDAIHFNFERIVDFPDWEIRQTATQLSPPADYQAA